MGILTMNIPHWLHHIREIVVPQRSIPCNAKNQPAVGALRTRHSRDFLPDPQRDSKRQHLSTVRQPLWPLASHFQVGCPAL